MLTALSLALVDFDSKLVKLFILIYRGSRWLLLLQLYLILTATGCRFLEQAQNARFIPAVNRMLFSFVSLSRCSWKMDHLSDLLLSVFSFLKFIHITMDLRRNQFCPLLLLLWASTRCRWSSYLDSLGDVEFRLFWGYNFDATCVIIFIDIIFVFGGQPPRADHSVLKHQIDRLVIRFDIMCLESSRGAFWLILLFLLFLLFQLLVCCQEGWRFSGCSRSYGPLWTWRLHLLSAEVRDRSNRHHFVPTWDCACMKLATPAPCCNSGLISHDSSICCSNSCRWGLLSYRLWQYSCATRWGSCLDVSDWG